MLPMSLFLHPRPHSRAVAPADATPRTRRAPLSPQPGDGTSRCDCFDESDDPAPAGLFTFRSEQGSARALAGRPFRHRSTSLGSSGDNLLAKHDSTPLLARRGTVLTRIRPYVTGRIAADQMSATALSMGRRVHCPGPRKNFNDAKSVASERVTWSAGQRRCYKLHR